MIQLYTPQRRQEILDYIGERYAECLYLYIDFMKYGDEVPFVKLYLQTKDNKITALVLQYHQGVHVYSRDGDLNLQELVQLLKKLSPSMICATDIIIQRLAAELPDYIPEYGFIGEVKKVALHQENMAVIEPTDKQLKDVAQMMCADEGLGGSYQVEELTNQLVERRSSSFGRNYILCQNGKIVCHAATGAELPTIAVTNAVITLPEYRGRGLATQVLGTLCAQLLKEGKRVFSVYYVPSAKKMHEKVGFEICNGWGKLTKKKEG